MRPSHCSRTAAPPLVPPAPAPPLLAKAAAAPMGPGAVRSSSSTWPSRICTAEQSCALTKFTCVQCWTPVQCELWLWLSVRLRVMGGGVPLVQRTRNTKQAR